MNLVYIAVIVMSASLVGLLAHSGGKSKEGGKNSNKGGKKSNNGGKKIKSLTQRIQDLEDGNKWELVFSAKSGTGENVYDAWIGDADINPNDENADLFKSPLAEEWGIRPVDQVRIELTNSSEVKAYFIFDGSGTNKATFMSPENFMASSSGNLVGRTDLSMVPGREQFSVFGTSRFNFRFRVMSQYSSCATAAGWLTVIDPQGENLTCVWFIHPKPHFLYCEGIGPCAFDIASSADTFRIMFKFA